MLITDDGQFAHDILSPKHHVPKTYIVTVDSPVTADVVKAFEDGVTLADGQLMKEHFMKFIFLILKSALTQVRCQLWVLTTK